MCCCLQVNQPDLVLFVGEALVGNEAVDQLVKFNQALADHSAAHPDPHLIDGIVLTKFDTIDDKVVYCHCFTADLTQLTMHKDFIFIFGIKHEMMKT